MNFKRPRMVFSRADVWRWYPGICELKSVILVWVFLWKSWRCSVSGSCIMRQIPSPDCTSACPFFTVSFLWLLQESMFPRFSYPADNLTVSHMCDLLFWVGAVNHSCHNKSPFRSFWKNKTSHNTRLIKVYHPLCTYYRTAGLFLYLYENIPLSYSVIYPLGRCE